MVKKLYNFRFEKAEVEKWKQRAKHEFGYNTLTGFFNNALKEIDKRKDINEELLEICDELKLRRDPEWRFREWQILCYLYRFKSLSMGDIASYLHCLPRDIYKSITYLIEKGYIKNFFVKQTTKYSLTVKGSEWAKLVHALCFEFNPPKESVKEDNCRLWQALSIHQFYEDDWVNSIN